VILITDPKGPLKNVDHFYDPRFGNNPL